MNVEVLDYIFDIVKGLLEVTFGILTGDRNFLRKEISSSSVFGNFYFSTIVNGEVASVYFFKWLPREYEACHVLLT
jgi:hypothetical protein